MVVQGPVSIGKLWFALVISTVYFTVEGSYRGGVRITQNTEVELDDDLLNPLGGNTLDDLTIQSMTVTRRNAAEDSSVVDSNGRYIGKHSRECSETFLLTPVRAAKTIGAKAALLEKGKLICHWEVIGSGDCVPVITCPNFTLAAPTPEDKDPCIEEYLELTDGSYGYQKYCGTEGPVKVGSGRSYRDLYVTLKVGAAGKAKNRAIGCVVSCLKEGEEDMKSLEENAEPDISKTCGCGRKPLHSERRRRREAKVKEVKEVKEGEGEAKRGEFPWIAALVAAGTRKPFCTGSIINDRFILTAAHCLRSDFANIANVEILIHPHELNVTKSVAKMQGMTFQLWTPEELKAKDKNDKSYRHTISRYFVHPLFVKQTNDFDVALIKLNHSIDFKAIKEVTPICLPDNGLWDQTKEETKGTISGWGVKAQIEGDEVSSVMTTLKKQQVEVFKNVECEDIFDWRFSHRMLCAGQRGEGEHLCAGDSGGPFISEKAKNIWEQNGLLAYAEGCVSKKGPGIYTNIREVVQWIRYVSTLEEAVWCTLS